MMRRLLTLAFGLGALAITPATANADMIELADGRSLHGEILGGQSTDDGLAVRVFDTGGIVVVDWEHIVPRRAYELKVDLGIIVPEDEQVTVTGHVVRFITNKQIRGVAENPTGGGPLRLKTQNGVQEYDRSTIGGIETVSNIPALEAYTRPELYQMKLDEIAPETAAAHFALADYCTRIKDFVHAKEHLDAAAADPDFGETPDGKSIGARQRRVGILIEAEGAADLAREIERAMVQKKWNQALEKLTSLDEQYSDEQIRNAIGYDRLENRVVKGRDKYFRKRVKKVVYDTMEKMLKSKVRERKPLRRDEEDPRAAMAGSLSGARQWAARELPDELWTKVAESTGLEAEELNKYWGERSSERGGKRTRTAHYGTGSFIVIKAATVPNSKKKRRRPPGAKRGKSGGGPQKEIKPKTDEEWWDAMKGKNDRWRFMEAYFVENSGIFEIIRTDETELCDNCAGKGFTSTQSSDGGENQQYCFKCNGGGKFRKVIYR